jgi:hypothetical protein
LSDNSLRLLDRFFIFIDGLSDSSLNFGDLSVFNAGLNRDFGGLDDFIFNDKFGGGGLNDSN